MDSKGPLLGEWYDARTPANERVDEGRQGLYLQRKKAKHLSVGVALLLLCIVWFSNDAIGRLAHWRERIVARPCQKLAEEKMIFDFEDITPSEKLQWHSCFGIAKCARLTVPLDYNRPLNVSKGNPKVHIALSMIPGAGHNETGKYSASPLLINPGGPGGSGAMFVVWVGSNIQGVVSSDLSQDIVGFDPRGVGATTPQADCWSYPSDGNSTTQEDLNLGAFHELTWTLTGAEIDLVNGTESALAQRDQRARVMSKLCKKQDDLHGEDSILRHVSTPAVARDMLSIIDAWDAWRAETQQDADVVEDMLDDNGSEEETENAHSLDTKGKLVYWGFSYGTLLGATFAAMFPDRVGRVVLDGVVDADYYVSPAWAESQRDADAIQELFYHYCHEAGALCHIYRNGDTEGDIKTRIQNIFESLRKNPLSGISPYGNVPFIFTHSALKMLAFSALYAPIRAFPLYAQVFDALERRDEEEVLKNLPVSYPDYKPFCSADASADGGGWDAQKAIMCTDKRYPLNETLPNLERRFEAMANISWFADVWMGIMIGCDGYNITPTDPPMRWDEHPAHRQKPISTSFPLLFLSNTADPVTPLFAGVKMAKKFVNAGLIEQQSEGHCSLAALSVCTMAHIRAYFEQGNVPPAPKWGPEGEEIEKGEWRRCEANEWPWKPFKADEWMAELEAQVGGGTTTADVVDVEIRLEEGRKEICKIAAWKEMQEVAKAFIQPRQLSVW